MKNCLPYIIHKSLKCSGAGGPNSRAECLSSHTLSSYSQMLKQPMQIAWKISFRCFFVSFTWFIVVVTSRVFVPIIDRQTTSPVHTVSRVPRLVSLTASHCQSKTIVKKLLSNLFKLLLFCIPLAINIPASASWIGRSKESSRKNSSEASGRLAPLMPTRYIVVILRLIFRGSFLNGSRFLTRASSEEANCYYHRSRSSARLTISHPSGIALCPVELVGYTWKSGEGGTSLTGHERQVLMKNCGYNTSKTTTADASSLCHAELLDAFIRRS